jgi:hypothetical protein
MSQKETPMRTLLMILFLYPSILSAQQTHYNLTVDNTDGWLVITLRTSDLFPCIGYSIRSNAHWDGDTAVVIVNGFIPPQPCIQGLDVAVVHVALKKKTIPSFFLKCVEQSFSDLWKVTPYGDGYRGIPLRQSFTSLPNY